MAEEENKWIDAISKLIKLTQKGKLEWKQAENQYLPESKTDNEKIYSVFLVYYKGKNLRIYKKTYLSSGFTLRSISMTGLLQPQKKTNWLTKAILEMIDSAGKALWTFPDEEILNDLLAAVEYQVAGVKQFLTDIFNEE